MRRAYLGIGTNVGDRAANLRLAMRAIAQHVTVRAQSSVYQTEPVGYSAQRSFWNMVVEVATSLTPDELLTKLIAVEEEMGRARTFRNAPRIIDLDILLYDDVIRGEPGLNIPHARMTERGFVLVPLVEIAPQLADPRSGRRFTDILKAGRFEDVEVLGRLEEIE